MTTRSHAVLSATAAVTLVAALVSGCTSPDEDADADTGVEAGQVEDLGIAAIDTDTDVAIGLPLSLIHI